MKLSASLMSLAAIAAASPALAHPGHAAGAHGHWEYVVIAAAAVAAAIIYARKTD